MSEPFVSVLIPTRAPGPGIEQVLNAVFQQRPSFDFEVLIVDSGSPARDLARTRQFPVALRTIRPLEFGHGRTRNLLGQLAQGEVFLYLSQDAEPASPDWMTRLVSALEDPMVAGAYARQLPRPEADPFACFFLQRTYGPRPARRSMRPGARLRLSDMFFSNVSSAIRRDVWERIPFREDVIMSEDQYWAHDVLHAGFEVLYEPSAQVYHSHNYGLQSLFRRNWQSGASLRGLIADEPHHLPSRAWSYLMDEIAFLARHGYWNCLLRLPLYESNRALAFAAGNLAAGLTERDRPSWFEHQSRH